MAVPLLAAESSGIVAPTLQEIQVAAHVIHFQETQPMRLITPAVVYNMTDRRSRKEANAIAALLGNGLAVADLTLHPLLIEQHHLTDSTAFTAVFATIGVDQGLPADGLKRRHALCLTTHLDQVEQGACTIAIRSVPSVSIAFNTMNAAAAGGGFITAFRMMVREI